MEIVHTEFLRTALGGQAVPDVTGSINTSTLNAILSSRDGILGAARLFEHLGVSGLAQAVEDTGVRAYKGQAGRLLINGNDGADVALESALRIHSVEARHAAKIRRMRRSMNMSDTSLRFSGYVMGGGVAAAGAGNIANPPAGAVAALGLIYGGEDNTIHTVFDGSAAVNIDAATLSGMSVIGEAGAQRRAVEMALGHVTIHLIRRQHHVITFASS